MGVAHGLQKLLEAGVVFLGHLQAHQYPAVVGALVAVVEQADVPAGAHGRQKLHQGAGSLGEHEAQQAFVVRQCRMPAHHVPNVLLRQIVVRQVQRFKTMLFQVQGDLAALPRAAGGHADKHMGFG